MIAPTWPPDPLTWGMLRSLRRYSLTGQGDDTTNCIRYVWEVLWIAFTSPRLRAGLAEHKSVLHLSGPGIGIGSFAHLRKYIELGIAEPLAHSDMGMPAHTLALASGWYLWQGWRKNGSGHCGFLLVRHDGAAWRIDASSDSEPAELTTVAKLEGAYETFQIVQLRRAGE